MSSMASSSPTHKSTGGKRSFRMKMFSPSKSGKVKEGSSQPGSSAMGRLPPPSASLEISMSDFPTPNSTPIPSPARMPPSVRLNSELDPFNVSGTGAGLGVSLDDEDTRRLLHDVSMSYSFPCKSLLKLAPIILLTATLAAVITSLALRSYTPYDASSRDFHAIFNNYLSKARYVDLTHGVSPSIPVEMAYPVPSFSAGKSSRAIQNFAELGQEFTYEEHGFISTSLVLGSDQLGTALEVPAKWNELGATLTDIPGSTAIRPIFVIDVTHQATVDPGYELQVSDIIAFERAHLVTISLGSVVAIRTDFSKSYSSFVTDGIPSTFPSISLEALEFLHDTRKVLMVGYEPFSVDSTASQTGAAWLAHKNRPHLKGLTNLDRVLAKGCLLSVGFLKVKAGTGGLGRFVAVCPSKGYSDEPEKGEVVAIDMEDGELSVKEHPLRRGVDGVLRSDVDASPTDYCKASNSLGCVDGQPVW